MPGRRLASDEDRRFAPGAVLLAARGNALVAEPGFCREGVLPRSSTSSHGTMTPCRRTERVTPIENKLIGSRENLDDLYGAGSDDWLRPEAAPFERCVVQLTV